LTFVALATKFVEFLPKIYLSILSAVLASGDVMHDECRLLCSVTPLGSK